MSKVISIRAAMCYEGKQYLPGTHLIEDEAQADSMMAQHAKFIETHPELYEANEDGATERVMIQNQQAAEAIQALRDINHEKEAELADLRAQLADAQAAQAAAGKGK